MWAFFVVRPDPGLGDFPSLLQIIEQIGIEDFMPIGSVKAFNKGILLKLTRLNVFQFDAFGLAPFGKDGGPEFRTVI